MAKEDTELIEDEELGDDGMLKEVDIRGDGHKVNRSNGDIPPEEFHPEDHPHTYVEDRHKEKIADTILNTPDNRMAELTWTPRDMYMPLCLLETIEFATDPNRNISLAKFLISRIDKRARAIDGQHLKRAVLLAGDEARANEEEQNRGGGVDW